MAVYQQYTKLVLLREGEKSMKVLAPQAANSLKW